MGSGAQLADVLCNSMTFRQKGPVQIPTVRNSSVSLTRWLPPPCSWGMARVYTSLAARCGHSSIPPFTHLAICLPFIDWHLKWTDNGRKPKLSSLSPQDLKYRGNHLMRRKWDTLSYQCSAAAEVNVMAQGRGPGSQQAHPQVCEQIS